MRGDKYRQNGPNFIAGWNIVTDDRGTLEYHQGPTDLEYRSRNIIIHDFAFQDGSPKSKRVVERCPFFSSDIFLFLWSVAFNLNFNKISKPYLVCIALV